ncbi:MAG: hypothetical protein V1866_02925 [archaeon]
MGANYMYQMIKKEIVLGVVERRGPIIPIHMKKELGASDSIIIGAILSELVSEGKVKITSTKIGGSPAYYTPGTEERLVDMIKHLNEKDRRTAELLQQKKILKDDEQSPLVRVSLRNIKDFAKPLEVNIKNRKEIYWKWYALEAKEAEQLIMGQEKVLKPEQPKIVAVEKPLPPRQEEKLIEKPRQETRKEEPPAPAALKKKKEKKEEKKEESKAPKTEEVQRTLGKSSSLMDLEKDAFFRQVRAYLEKNDISILDYKIIKKSDIELMLSIPSRIGSQEYYCKAKSKKRISDGDLSSAYIQGQASKLPILFLTPGDLTKKAKEMLAKEFKGMTVKTI